MKSKTKETNIKNKSDDGNIYKAKNDDKEIYFKKDSISKSNKSKQNKECLKM
jgi:hypothetical protein